VQCQRYIDPLIFFDAAVIVAVKKGEVFFFVQRALFDVDARSVAVRDDDVYSFSD